MWNTLDHIYHAHELIIVQGMCIRMIATCIPVIAAYTKFLILSSGVYRTEQRSVGVIDMIEMAIDDPCHIVE